MAASMVLITKSNPEQPEKRLINGIHAVVINTDDAGSDAVMIAEAEAVLVANGHPVPSGYFDTVTKLADLGTDEDTVIIEPRNQTFIIA